MESAPLAKVLDNKELSDLVTALGCGLGKNFEISRLRYGKIIILADADADGNHIATLLLTFVYRHLPHLITHGKVYLAQPPPHRIDIGKQTHWALDEADRGAILERADQAKAGNGRHTPEITRFKGLGEMMPKVLWETTLNPKTRRLLRVEIAGSDRHRPDHQRADGKRCLGPVQVHHGACGRGGRAGCVTRGWGARGALHRDPPGRAAP